MKTYLPHIELFHNSADAMFMLSEERFIDCNDATAKIFGYPHKEAMLERHPSEVSPPFQPDGSHSYEKASEMIQLAIKQGNNRFQWMHRRADGSEFWAEVSLTRIHLDGKDIVYAVVRDIHEAKLSQENLLAAKHQMEDIITHFPVAIVRAETDNVNVGYFNDKFHEFFGWELSDISTMDKWFTSAYPNPDYREKIIAEWQALIQKTHDMGLVTSPHPMEAKVRCKNGDVKICQAWYHWNAGNVFGIFHDITAQRNAETDLKKAHKELASKNRELEEMNTSLDNKIKEEIAKQRHQEQILIQQSKMAAMGEMIGAIAHQWRQPLNVIALNIQDLQDAYAHGEMNDAYLQGMVTKSMEVVNYMSQTIDDFRNFFKPDKSIIDFNLTRVLDEAIKIVETQFRSYNIAIDTRYKCPQNCLIPGFPSEIKQLLLNLLNNAKDAILQWRKDNEKNTKGEITVSVTETQSQILLTIEDNGGGIPDAIMDKIFDPYFTTKHQGEGTGLGLYMSKIIIDKHMKGMIRSENIPGGARFEIAFNKHLR